MRCLGALFALLAMPSFGAAQLSFLVDARHSGPSVIVNEITVLTIRSKVGKATAEERAHRIATNLLAVKEGDAVSAAKRGKDWAILLGDKAVITVTEAEAKAQASNPEALANAWASRINNAIATQGIEVSTTTLSTPPDKLAVLEVVGSHARKATLSGLDSKFVRITRETGRLLIKPLSLGGGELKIASGPLARKVTLRVLPYAARFPMHLRASVIGRPAMSANVESAVLTAVNSRAPLSPAATYRLGPFEVPELAPGASHKVDIPIKVEAPDAFPVSGLVRVTVSNLPAANPNAEAALWYSNDPENLVGPGQIYWAQFESNSPVRLLFHHFNKSPRPLAVQFVLVNPNDQDAEISMTMGEGDPSDNPTLAGYQAGDRFFQSWLRGSGEVVVLPARSVLPIALRRIAPAETMSGLATIAVRSKVAKPIVLVGDSITPERVYPLWRSIGYTEWPWRKIRPMPLNSYGFPTDGEPKHVYPKPLREVAFDYRVGGPFAFIRVGQEAISDIGQIRVLEGNFGVQYDIRGRMGNPTDKPTDVEVIFEASAGYSGALFVVNGRYMAANLLQAKAIYPLLSTTLAAGETKPLRIQTIPLSGAHYPATITIRPRGVIDD